MRLLTCAACAGLLLLMAGCAPALPGLGSGGLTPKGRYDTSVGGSARIPVGRLRKSSREALQPFGYQSPSVYDGVIPVAAARYGLREDWDMGLAVLGTTLRMDARHAIPWHQGLLQTAWLIGGDVYAGWIDDTLRRDDGSDVREVDALRAGMTLPATLGLRVAGLYEAWVGARAGFEYAGGDLRMADQQRQTVDLWAVRGGLMLGVGLGFRYVHVLIELNTDYEHWFASVDDRDSDHGGVVLTPAFRLRIRWP